MAVDWLQLNSTGALFSSAVTMYMPPHARSLSSTESQVQWKARASYTVKNFSVYCSSYSSSGTNNARTRKNTANGNLVVTINASGLFEDTSHTDSLTSTA